MDLTNDCCSALAALADDESSPVRYGSKLREWQLALLKPDEESTNDWMRNESVMQGIEFCPFCSAKLPASLRDEWFDTLEAMGFDEPFDQDVPEEFRSDRWWKERGL